jgi:uncharacterized protein with von Willebrand factor type A (vWA) domain
MMPETIEERLANSPVRGVIEVIDAVQELRRRAERILWLEAEIKADREATAPMIENQVQKILDMSSCPSCGWPRGGARG